MPPIPGMMHWHSLIARHAKSLKAAFQKASQALDAQLSSQAQGKAQSVLVRNTPRQPLHPLARIRQGQSRWYSSTRDSLVATVRTFTTSSPSRGVRYDRASLPKSRISQSISRSSGRAPFASTLRPNVTGGTLGRTAGGYTLGGGRAGGARYFSHGPACQAQVVQNVSQAMRAFLVGGQKAQYNGISSFSGEKRYKAVSELQEETGRKMRSVPKATPGSYIEFSVNPTITALTPLSAVTGYRASSEASPMEHLNTAGLLDVLSVDFSRALKDLASVLNDLNRLSALGDLPITYQASTLRIHFPGCDAETVETLCDELDVQRGMVVQDEAFDSFVGTQIALLFPFAPSMEASEASDLFDPAAPLYPYKKSPINYADMFSASAQSAHSTQSEDGFDQVELARENPWLSSPSAYESVHYSSSESEARQPSFNDPLEYQGFEGIYRFIEQCDSARRQ